jgi:hypothetical protein
MGLVFLDVCHHVFWIFDIGFIIGLGSLKVKKPIVSITGPKPQRYGLCPNLIGSEVGLWRCGELMIMALGWGLASLGRGLMQNGNSSFKK